MTTASRRLFLASAILAACAQRATERCAHCGMTVRSDSRWRAGATVDGRPVLFDAPRCLFQYRFAAPGRALAEPWVIEHYGPGDRRTPAREVRFVPGSRLRGPMGIDLVPVAPASAERFRADHGGRAALSYDDVSASTIDAL